MLTALPLKQKLWLMMIAAAIGMAVISTIDVLQFRAHALDARRQEARAALQTARSYVIAIQDSVAKGTRTEADAQALAKQVLSTARYGGVDGKANYFYIFTPDGVSLMNPYTPQFNGTSMLGKVPDGFGGDMFTRVVAALRTSTDGEIDLLIKYARPGQTQAVPKLQRSIKVQGWNWYIGTGIYVDEVDAQVFAAARSAALLTLGVLAVIGGICFLICRRVLRQLGGEPAEATRVMHAVAGGNLYVTLPAAAPESLLGALSAMVATWRDTVGRVRSASDSISTASSEIATGNLDLSQRTEQTASNLQQAASSMTELSGTVQQSASAAAQANQLAASASSIARSGGDVVGQVMQTMDEINTSSKRIADIIGTIDGIAFQTNILALNAAVEAARAGEQGRGFAVVASEVRSLAQRSAGAAKEIKSLIGTSVDKVETGTRLVQNAGKTMTEIVASVQRVTDVISEISASSSEQSTGIGQISSSVSQVDQMTQQNAALVEQSAAAAESLKGQAHRLSEIVSAFRLTANETSAAPATKARRG